MPTKSIDVPPDLCGTFSNFIEWASNGYIRIDVVVAMSRKRKKLFSICYILCCILDSVMAPTLLQKAIQISLTLATLGVPTQTTQEYEISRG